MRKVLLFIVGAFIFCSATSFATLPKTPAAYTGSSAAFVPTFTILNKKDACNGLSNGSFQILISAITGPNNPASVIVLGDNVSFYSVPVGVPYTISGLAADGYDVAVNDGAGTMIQPVTIGNVTAPLVSSINSQINNTDCGAPNGSIDIDVSGGSGSYSYAWTGPSGYTATTQDISSLPGGVYSVVISDNNTNCTLSPPNITLTDPSPVVQTISTTSPAKICFGQPVSITLGSSEAVGVTYEILRNGSPTGNTLSGTGGPLTFTLPWGSFADGDGISVRGANGSCTPILMNGLVIIQVAPLPVPTLNGTTPVCATSTGNIYVTDPGMTNYVWNVVGGTITAGGTATSSSVTVTWGAAGAGSVSVNYTNSDGCTATASTTFNVTISPIPTPTISGPAARCVNSTGAQYVTEAGQSSYVWNVTGGTITAGAGTNEITVTWTSTGAQTVTVNYQNASGCTAAAPTTYNVNVTPLPTPTLGGTFTVCLNDAGLTYTTDNGMTNYVWTVVGGTITAGGSATDPSVTVTWSTLAGAHSVSVNYTNPAGCAAATPTTSTVTVNDLPTPTVGGPNKICANTTGNAYTTEAGQSNYVWTVSAGGTITSGAGTNAIQVTWNTAGAQTVTVNYDNAAGCDATTPTSYNVTVDPLPTPVITGPAAVCEGATTVVYNTAAGMTNYVWNVTGGTITAGGTATSPSVTVSWPTAGPGSVSVSYTDANGCTPAAPTVYNVTVSALPVPTIAGLATVCANTTGVTYTTEAGMSGYVWTVSAGGTITAGAGTNQITVTWAAAGARTVRVNYNNPAGCTATTPTVLNVTVNARPTPTITGGLSTVCAGLTGGTYSTLAGQSNYVWTVSAGGTITAGGGTGDNSVTITWNTAGTQTVTVNYTNAAGCAAATPASRTITVNPLPVPILTGPLARCVGSTGAVYATDAGMSGYIWTVSAGGTITSGVGTNSIQVTWNTTGPQTVSVNYTNANGCTATTATTVNVAVNPVPTPSLSGSAAECVGATNVNYTTDAGQSNYVWTVSAGGTITSGAGTNSINVTWNTVGPQTVSVNYENASGCPASAATVLNVAINAAPAPTITGSATQCVGATNVAYSTQPGQSNYVWTVSAGGTITSGAGTNSIEVTWNTAGPQTVSVNYQNTAGCTAATPTVQNVVVNPRPTPTLGGPLNPCIGASGITYTTDDLMSNYVWNVSAGGTITAGGTATSRTVTVNWTTAGAQTVSVSYTDANGCTPVTPTVVNILVSPIPTPTISGLNAVCANTNGVTYTTESGMNAYVWSLSAGGTIVSGAGTNQITVNWGAAGTRTVRVNYNNAAGCPAPTATAFTVTVNPRPTITILGGAATACVGQSVTYTTQTGRSNYQWTISPGGTITAGGGTTNSSVTVTWNTAGAQSVSVNYAITATGCEALTPTTRAITVNPLPTPTITGPAAPCVSTTSVNYNTQTGMTGYVWTVSAGGTITAGAGTNAITVVWSAAGPQTVTVNYADANGCAAATPTTYNVNVNATPTPGLLGVTAVCAGTTNVAYTTDAGQSNYVWTVPTGGTITSGAGTNAIQVTWNTAGTHTVSVNYDNTSGCPATSPTTVNVVVNPLPTPTINGGAATACINTSVTYNTEAGMTNYVWTVSAGGTITAGAGTNTIDVTWATAGAKTVSVNYDDANGCDAATATVRNITVNPLPTPTIGGPLAICVSATGVTYSTQPGMTGYLWTVSGGGTITAGAGTSDITVVWSAAGPQTVTVNYTDANGCTATTPTTINVNVTTTPTPALSGLTDVCAGTTNVTYTTDAGQTNYQWTVPTGGTITSGTGTNAIQVTWTTAGTHTVSVNYDNALGCPAGTPTTVNVVVDPVPTPTISGGTATACVNATVTYNTEAGMTNYVWTVSAGGTITAGAGTNTIDVTWATAGAQTVSVNYDNADGCDAPTATVRNITVNPLPTPTVSGPAAPCVSATGINYNTQPGMTGYVWTVSAGGTITAGAGTESITVVWSAAGPQTLTVTYTDANGCAAATPATYNVNVSTVPTPGLVGLTDVCVGTTNVTYTTDAGQNNYVWIVSVGGTITSGAGTNAIEVTWATAGPQTVSVNYDNTAGCPPSSPTVVNVDVNPVPTPTISGPSATECVGASVIYTTQPGMTNYVWTVPVGGTITAGGTPTSDFVEVTWNTAGPQTVTVNYTDANGCSAATPATFNVAVSGAPTPTILGGAASECEGATVTYTTQPGMTNYQWNVTGGTITSGGSTTDDDITISWTTAGTGTISVNYENAGGCAAASATTRNITINAAPAPTILGLASTCAGATNVTYTTEAGMGAYVWIVNGGTITAGAGTNQITVSWPTAGSHSVSVNYTNPAGCSATAPTVLAVNVNTTLVPSLAGPTDVCLGATTVTYNTDPGQNNYVWTVTGGTITAGGTLTDDFADVTWGGGPAGTISVNYDNTVGCPPSTATTVNVDINPLPTPSIGGGSATECVGESITYNTEAGMTGYVWTVSAGGTITAGAGTNTIDVTWNTAGPQSVTVTYTDPNGCSPAAPTSFNVTVNSGAATAVLNGPAAACEGDTNVVYDTDPGKTNYVWTVSAGGTITSGAGTNSIEVTWATAGTQTVSVTYTDTNGCPILSPATLAVTVNPAAVPTLTGDADVCVTETGVTYSTDAGQSNYTWTVSGGTITAGATTNQITVTWNTAGNQTVTVTYTPTTGCPPATPTSFAVNVHALPVPTVTASAGPCENTTVTYTTELGMTNFSWTVTGGTVTGGGTVTDSSVTVAWGAAGSTGSVSINYTDANGCTAATAVTQAITVSPLPVPTLTGPLTPCEDEAGQVYITQPGQTNYVWTVAGGTITAGGTAADDRVTITWTSPGTQTVSVNYTNAAGCTGAAPFDLTVNVKPAPIPTISGTNALCKGAVGEVYTTEAGMTNYVWSVTGGTITGGGGLTDNNITVDWPTAGAGVVSVNYTNTDGCAAGAPVAFNVTVQDTPTATMSGASSACIGTPGTITVTLTGGGPWDIEYTDGTNTFQELGITSSPAAISVSPTVTTTYSMVSVSNGCGPGTFGGSAIVTITPVPGDPTVFGVETWIGYVYNDAGDVATPLPGRINFSPLKYRGYIEAADIDNMSPTSTYDVGTDEFDMNVDLGAVSGPNVCGTFSDNFSIRYRMQKTLPEGIYVFNVGADDGARLLINGSSILPTSAFNTPHTYSVVSSPAVCLAAATYNIVIEYYDVDNQSRISFDYEQILPPDVTSPVTTCVGSALPTLTASSPHSGLSTFVNFNWYLTPALTTVVGTGPTFTPTAAQLNMGAPNSRSFYVAMQFTCGRTEASVVQVDVVNSASITVADQNICESGGIIDLTSFVSATPAGGTFSFSGSPAISGTNFDPSGLAGTTANITVNYTIGGCTAPAATFDIDVTNSATITVADQDVCESGGIVDLTSLVSAIPAGGTFTFSGSPAISGTNFDPTGLAGTTATITVNYSLGTCAAPPATFDIDVTNTASITVADQVVCESGGIVDLTSFVTATPGGGTLSFSGSPAISGTDFDPTGLAGTTVTITVNYSLGTCAAPPATFDIDVTNTASIAVTDQSVCESGGIVDLTGYVTVTPVGGTLSFSGSPAISGTNFDPTGLAGTTVTITVNYSLGTCTAPPATFDMDINNSGTLTVPTTTQTVCETGADIDLTTLVSATPSGGTFTFTGPNVSGTTFDPSGLSGNQTINVSYTGASCPVAPASFTINVTPTATFNVTNSAICQNGTAVNLMTLTSNGAPAGGTFAFTGAGVSGTTFSPAGQPIGNATIAVTYTVTGCSVASNNITINVLDPATNPSCGGGGTNCFVFNATVNTALTKRPTCEDGDDGVFAIDVNSTTGGNIIVQLIAPDGTIVTQVHAPGLFTFPGLSPANYEYKLTDQFGNICQQPYSLPVVTTVEATAAAFQNVTCFGDATGKATITGSRSTSGQYYYSLDGGTSWSGPKASPFDITDLPPNGTYGILVGDKVNDACAASVQVTINNAFSEITATFDVVEATCSGNDGALTVNATGGNGSYQYSLDGITYKTSNNFTGLSGGGSTVYIQDGSGCVKALPYMITFPGYIAYDPPVVQPADCNNNGESGAITITLTGTVGPNQYQVAISTDMFTEPDASQYRNYSLPNVKFDKLPAGTYYIYIKAINASASSCATRTAGIDVSGVQPLTYTVEQGCQNGTGVNVDRPFLFIKDIAGDNVAAIPPPVTVSVKRVFPPADVLTKSINLSSTNSVLFTYDADPGFMQFPGEYVITLSQINSVGGCLVTKTFTYNVPILLSAQVGGTSKSYPELPTGSLQVVKFFGGVSPYDVRIELDSASSFSLPAYATNFEEVVANSNLDYAKQYRNIPAGRYKVQVVDSLGCFIQFNARVPLDTDVYIPNIFTPNEDGVNDVFFVRNLPAGARLVITNRWGKEVYASNDYQNDWKGEGVADGIYFYRLKGSDSESKPISGWIEILRGNKP